MRRGVSVALSAVLAALLSALLPAGLAIAAQTPASLGISPVIDTRETGGIQTLTVLVRDSAGAVIQGITVDMAVTVGPHANNDLDGNGTPDGRIGECVTTSAGTCSLSYTGPEIGDDTVRSWIDAGTPNQPDSAELASDATIHWVATGAGTRTVRIDMAGCDGDMTAPVDNSTWNATGFAVTVGGVMRICAARFSSSDVPTPGPITFTITSGPGHFTSFDGTANYGTSIVRDADSAGVAALHLTSTVSGTSAVQASAAAVSAAGSAPWTAGTARAVTLPGPATGIPGGSRDVPATVVDQYGNPVQGTVVHFASTGPGHFANGQQTQDIVTGTNGIAVATVTTSASDSGDETATALIDASTTDCDRAAGDPAGAAAGVCSAQQTITWGTTASVLSFAVTPGAGVIGTPLTVSGRLSSSNQGVPSRSVNIDWHPWGTNGWTPLTTASTAADGSFAVRGITPTVNTEFRARWNGDATIAPSVSRTVFVLVRKGIALNVSPAAPVHGSAAVFSGLITPAHPSTSIYLQRLSSSGWTTIASVRTTSASRYTFRVVKNSPGVLLFRTVVASDADHGWNASTNRQVDWH